MTAYEDLRRAVLAALAREDPMDLADPDNDLDDEYDAEAREIARLMVHAGGTDDAAAFASAIAVTFAESFGERLPPRRVARIAAALELGETSAGDLSTRLGEADVVAAYARALVAASGRRAVVTVETNDVGRSSVLIAAPPGEDEGTEPLSIGLLGPGDGEVRVRSALIELGAGDLGPHQPLREAVAAIEQLVVAVVAGDVHWYRVVRRRDDIVVSEKVSVVTADGPFEIETHLGNGGWGRTRRIYGNAAPYPRQGALVVADEGDATGTELWGCYADVSGLTVRDGAVRIPVRRPVTTGRFSETAAARPSETMVIEPATAVEVHDPHYQPWFSEFDGLHYGPGGEPEVRFDGVPEVRVIIRGRGTTVPRVRLEPPSGSELESDRSPVAVTLPREDGSIGTFVDIDAARFAFQNRKTKPGTYDGHDADGYRVTIVVADVSARWRRRPRARRWLGPRIEVTSTTTGEQVGMALANDARRVGASG